MDLKEHTRSKPRRFTVTPSSADIISRRSTSSTRPSHTRSKHGSTYRHRSTTFAADRLAARLAAKVAKDAEMAKKFKLFMIGSIVMDVFNFIVTVVVALLYYAALTRRKYLKNGTYIEISDKEIAELRVHTKYGEQTNETYGYGAQNFAHVGVPIAWTLAAVCVVCLIIDALCCVVVKSSLRDPKGPKARLGWFIGTGILILFTMIQVIILIAILSQARYLLVADDYADLEKEANNKGKDMENILWSAGEKLEDSTCYPAIITGFIVMISRACLIKLILAMKNAFRGATEGPVLVPPAPSRTPSKIGTGDATSQNKNIGSPA